MIVLDTDHLTELQYDAKSAAARRLPSTHASWAIATALTRDAISASAGSGPGFSFRSASSRRPARPCSQILHSR